MTLYSTKKLATPVASVPFRKLSVVPALTVMPERSAVLANNAAESARVRRPTDVVPFRTV